MPIYQCDACDASVMQSVRGHWHGQADTGEVVCEGRAGVATVLRRGRIIAPAACDVQLVSIGAFQDRDGFLVDQGYRSRQVGLQA